MEVEDDGEFNGGVDGGGGEQTEPEVVGGVNGDVGGFDAVNGGGVGGEWGVEEMD